MTSVVFHQSMWYSDDPFFYLDQFYCHCIFIYSNLHWQLLSSLHDGFLHCFCLGLLVSSYETTNNHHRLHSLWSVTSCLWAPNSARFLWEPSGYFRSVCRIGCKSREDPQVNFSLAPTSWRLTQVWTGHKYRFSGLRYDPTGNRTSLPA